MSKREESIEQSILYSNNSSKSEKRLALTVLLSKELIDTKTISRIVGVGERQVVNHQKKYKEQGVESFTKDTHYKPTSELLKHKDQIYDDLVNHPVATAAEASERILSLTDIKRSPTQVRQFMHSMGLKHLKVAGIPAKADTVKQSEFLETSLKPKIQEAKNDERVLLFLDASHFIWQLYLGILWCVSRIFIPASSGRTRINVLGAYDPIKNKLIKIINRSYVTSSTIIELFEMIKATYKDKVITIVLDNARYQRCMAVIEKAAELHIELLYLPTYSLNLNLIERLWRFVKKDCLYSKYYPTADDFENAIVKCLDEIDTTKKDKLISLMALKFQVLPTEKQKFYSFGNKVA